MRIKMFDSVRTRLTLWHTGVLALVLIGFSLAVYALLSRSLYRRLDDDLRTTVKEMGFSLADDIDAGEAETKAAANGLYEHIGPRQSAAIFDAEGRLIAENPSLSDVHAQLPAPGSIPADQARLYTIPSPGSAGRRVAVQRITLGNPGRTYLMVVDHPLDEVANQLKTIRVVFYLAISVALLFAGLSGWFLARRSLAPVVDMMERARQISAENLEQRLPIANPHDELGRLASTFNALLIRLDDSFAAQRRFMADASHELRTPLSVMQTATGVTLAQSTRDESEYREGLRVIDQQVRRLTKIVQEMFTLARADAGGLELHYNDFYLDEMILETSRAAEILAIRKDVKIDVGRLSETPYHGDEGLLRQMLLNLLHNAIKHTLPGGSVSLKLQQHASQYEIIVSDTGLGIPLEAQTHIFERFYHVDKARSRNETTEDSGGAGLGLSIAKWIAEAHRGSLKLQHSDQTGTTFVAFLPVVPHRQ
jgi:heavy metal sensor kinase